MNAGGGGDHGVLGEGVGAAVHEAGVFAEAGPVHGQYLRGAFEMRGPGFDFAGLSRVLAAGDFHSFLEEDNAETLRARRLAEKSGSDFLLNRRAMMGVQKSSRPSVDGPLGRVRVGGAGRETS